MAGQEDYLLEAAATFDRRLVVFTGCVLDPDDPTYREIQIPQRFFKVAVFLDAGEPAATGYILDQTSLVDDLDLPSAQAAGGPPPLGPYRTFQVPITEIATMTGLGLAQLADLDRLPVPAAARPDTPRWRRLTAPADITWRPTPTS